MRMNKQEHWEVQEDQEYEDGITVINYWDLNDHESENHCMCSPFEGVQYEQQGRVVVPERN